MTELEDRRFEDLFRTEPLQQWAAGFDAARRIVLRRFWVRLGGGLAAILLLVVVGASVDRPDATTRFALGFFGVPILLMLLAFYAHAVLKSAAPGLKQSALEAIGRAMGLDYRPSAAESPLGAEASAVMFGPWPFTREIYTDVFHGHDPDGRHFVMFEALLARGHGRGLHSLMLGQVHALSRSAGPAETLICSERAFTRNYVRPPAHLQPVEIAGDERFARLFDVHSSDPYEAKRMLSGTQLSRFLLERRMRGRVYVYIGPVLAILAAYGKDRFELGNPLRGGSARDRARRIYDDVTRSLAEHERFRSILP